MNENVENVNNDSEFITVRKKDFTRLKQEREEYRQIALDLQSGVNRMKASLGGGVSNE